MLMTIHYPCRIDGVPLGARKSSSFFTWRRTEVELQDITPDQLQVAVNWKHRSITKTWRDGQFFRTDEVKDSETNYYAVNGEGLFKILDQDQIDKITARQMVFQEILGVETLKVGVHPNADSLKKPLPAFKRIDKDHGDELDLLFAQNASKRYAINGKVLVPVGEPYFEIKLNGSGRYDGRSLGYSWKPKNDWPEYGFRADEQALALELMRSTGASEEEMAEFLEVDQLDVRMPQVLQFDPHVAKAIYYARKVLDEHRENLSSLETHQISAWSTYRDFIYAWQADADAPIEDLVAALDKAFAVLQYTKYLKVNEKAAISRFISGKAPELAPDDDLDAIGASAGP